MYKWLYALTYNQALIILLLLNFFVSLVIFTISSQGMSGDHADYIRLSDSLINAGIFSSFYEFENYYANTVRTPGYPLFISGIRIINDNLIFVKLIQLALYFVSLILFLKIIQSLSQKRLVHYLFLTSTAICIQLPYYAGLILSETISIFMISLIFYIIFFKLDYKISGILSLGLILGLLSLTRPVFFLLPFLISFFYLFQVKSLQRILLLNLTFFILLSPWVVWNIQNHEKATPLTIQGGPIPAHTSFWMNKLPYNYRLPKSIYAPVIYPDLLDPYYYIFDDDKRQSNLHQFLAELDDIDKAVEHILSDQEKIDVERMDNTEGIFNSYPSEYTILKEQEYSKKLIQNIMNEPLYFFNTRIYTFYRLLVTGINPDIFSDNSNISSINKVQRIFSTLITFFILFIPFLITIFFYLKHVFKVRYEMHIAMFFIAYSFAVYLPFPPQSRYLIPVHLIIILINVMVLLDRNRLLKKSV